LNLTTAHSIYFLGIGGVGMSALARYFKREGKVVYGYDRVASVITQGLEAEGIPVAFRPHVGRVEQADLVDRKSVV
jgi:UDP-N-acetylmuramate--alanine ligase